MQTSFAEAPSVTLPTHLVGVPGMEWAFWKWVGLRSAGFPANNILKLAAPRELGVAVDQLEASLKAKDAAFDKALRQINSVLDDWKQNGKWDDKQGRAPLLKAKRKLEARQLPGCSPEIDSLDSIRELRACVERVDALRVSFENLFTKVSVQTSLAISEFVGCDRFCEAMAWQNRKVVHRVQVLRDKPPQAGERNSRLRQHEEMIATYLQRYCVKNDTIGFFGPVGWAKFVPDGERLTCVPGAELIAERHTYWESWPIEKLAAVIERNPAVLPWIPPTTMPFLRLAGSTLHHPVFGPQEITSAQSALVQSCNGRDAVNQIVAKMLQLPGGLFKSESEVYECLRDLAARRIISWAINIPAGPFPEQALRDALERIGDPDIKRSSLEMFEELDGAKRRVAAAAGNAEDLNSSLDHLEQVFTRLTSEEATRHPGKSYAGRTLVYEDCRRDLDVALGPALLQELAVPLSLLLISARWITAEIREAYRKKLLEIYAELVASTGNPAVDAAALWTRLRPIVIDSASLLTRPVQQEFEARWHRILRIGQESGPIHYSSNDLRERVLAEFAAGQTGWVGARYHSPDLMIAADDEDAIRRGEYSFVLGELHVSANTLGASLFVNQHPSPEELLQAVEYDLGALNVVPVSPKNEQIGSRMELALIGPSNLRLEYAENAFETDRSRALPVSALFLQLENGRLLAKTRDARFEFDAVDVIRPPLLAFVIDSFKMAAPQAHSPRVSIDRLVIKRESWQCPAAELAFAREPNAADRYAWTRKWRQGHAMPRFVFFKAPVEPKPCYLDFESPILVDVFCKMVRRTQEAGSAQATIEVFEMLPRPEQIWLRDAEDRRYTSEFRLVAVDLKR